MSAPQHAPQRAREAASLFAQLDTYRRVAEQRGPVRPAEGRLLWLLSDGRARTLGEIAEDLNLEQSTVNRQVNGALKAGLVERTRDGGRAWRFAATSQGAATFETALTEHLTLHDGALAAVRDPETFLAELALFVDAYGAALHRN